jgi:hypothetical protein
MDAFCKNTYFIFTDKGKKDFSFPHSVHTSSGTHSASYEMGTRDCLLVVKRLRHEADHSPPSNVEIKNGGVIFSLPHIPPWLSS